MTNKMTLEERVGFIILMGAGLYLLWQLGRWYGFNENPTHWLIPLKCMLY